MRKEMKKILGIILTIAMAILLVGCRQAQKVSYNVSKQADNFNVVRRLTVINTRSDKCVLQMTGKMSIEDVDHGLAVLIELDRDKGLYQKHYVYMNEWTMYTVEDLNGVSVSKYAYELEFMPASLVPVKITADEIDQDIDQFVRTITDSESEDE